MVNIDMDKRSTNMNMYFANVVAYNPDVEDTYNEDLVVAGTSYSDAVVRIERVYGPELMSISRLKELDSFCYGVLPIDDLKEVIKEGE